MKYLALFLLANIFVASLAVPRPLNDVAINPFIVGGVSVVNVHKLNSDNYFLNNL